MALIPCKECGKEISTQALACPACGARTPRASRLYAIVATTIAVFGIATGVWRAVQPSAAEEAAKTASDSLIAQRETQDKARAADSLAIDASFDSLARDTASLTWKEAESEAKSFKISTDSLLKIFRPYNHLIRKKNPQLFSDFIIGDAAYAIEQDGVRGKLGDYFLATVVLYDRGYDDIRVRQNIVDEVRSIARITRQTGK